MLEPGSRAPARFLAAREPGCGPVDGKTQAYLVLVERVSALW
jgi:hypothetical protein